MFAFAKTDVVAEDGVEYEPRYPSNNDLSMNRHTNKAVIIIAIIFSLISLFHFYWALGGQLWYEEVLPTNSLNTKRLNPSPTAALIVAFGMLLMAFVVIGCQGFFDKYLNRKYFRYGTLFISLIFLVRAIGDFRFVGFFKTVTGTRFGVNDTLFFSPLCILISGMAFFVFMTSRGPRSEVGGLNPIAIGSE